MRNVLSMIAGSSLAVLSLPAGAVEVRQVTEIAAPPARVWAKVGDWCAIKDWHPAISGCSSEKKGFRTLTLKDGGRIVEKQTKTGKFSYSYDIVDSPLPVKNYSATLTAKPDSNGNTDLTWTAKFDAKDKNDAEAEAVIKGIFEAGLKNVKSNVKFDGSATASAAAAGAAATAAGSAATGDAKAQKEAERKKAREERQQKIAAMKAVAAEKYASAKLAAAEKYAKAKAYAAEKAKAAYDAAKAAYDKAKTLAAPASDPAKPKAP
ncbi:MAG: SRPBCC family protein [Hyphomicrobiaceae bacterium]|nr:SRPBCC family protein [Hyphomicrobiaceae bacterium]